METILLKIKRQDDPGDLPYWEKFEIPYSPGMTVAAALEAVCEKPSTHEGHPTSPIAFDASCMEGACGSCAMLINGKARLACRCPVEDLSRPIVIEPLSKFPLIRDLKVDRLKMYGALQKCACWIDIDGLADADAPSAKISGQGTSRREGFLECAMCGACVEACPQVNERSAFSGAFVFAHILALNTRQAGTASAGIRMDALAQRGGLADCANAGNCAFICPQGIGLTEATSRLGLMAARYSLGKFFRG